MRPALGQSRSRTVRHPAEVRSPLDTNPCPARPTSRLKIVLSATGPARGCLQRRHPGHPAVIATDTSPPSTPTALAPDTARFLGRRCNLSCGRGKRLGGACGQPGLVPQNWGIKAVFLAGFGEQTQCHHGEDSAKLRRPYSAGRATATKSWASRSMPTGRIFGPSKPRFQIAPSARQRAESCPFSILRNRRIESAQQKKVPAPFSKSTILNVAPHAISAPRSDASPGRDTLPAPTARTRENGATGPRLPAQLSLPCCSEVGINDRYFFACRCG